MKRLTHLLILTISLLVCCLVITGLIINSNIIRTSLILLFIFLAISLSILTVDYAISFVVYCIRKNDKNKKENIKQMKSVKVTCIVKDTKGELCNVVSAGDDLQQALAKLYNYCKKHNLKVHKLDTVTR